MNGLTVIPIAKESPRISDSGVIYWYHGDAFDIEWTIHLISEETGEEIEFQPGDSFEWNFWDADKKLIQTFHFDYADIQEGNIVILEFTPEVSNKFAVGKYTYCMKYFSYDGYITTINAKNKVRVQACH